METQRSFGYTKLIYADRTDTRYLRRKGRIPMELEEIYTLEDQGFEFYAVQFKRDGTILVDMIKEGKIRPMPFPGVSITEEVFADLFRYITRRISEQQAAIEKQRKKK